MHHRYGMMLFIASEVMFFVAWFWAYFDAFFRHDDPEQPGRVAAIGGQLAAGRRRALRPLPPAAVQHADPALPRAPRSPGRTTRCSTTTARASSGASSLTIALGALFTCVQVLEYSRPASAIAGNIYGATFFMATGFHGFHVLIGTIFLIVCLVRANVGHFTPKHHLGFEFAAWYWHFVDVVWLFLFASIYVWGSWGVAIHH